MASKKIAEILGDKAKSLLVQSNRNNRVVGSMSTLPGKFML
jgi:hypothetical protein